MCNIINIALLQSTKDFDIEYSYLADDGVDIKRGSFVKVPFGKGNRVEVAIVTTPPRPYVEGESKYKLKTILGIEEYIKPLSKEQLELCEQIVKYYMCTMGDAVRCLVPPQGNRGIKVNCVSLIKSHEQIQQAIDAGVLKNIKHIQFIELLEGYGVGAEPRLDEIIKSIGCSVSIANTLVKGEFIKITKKNLAREEIKQKTQAFPTYSAHILNEGQQKAYDEIIKMIDRRRFGEALLHGVTGSGKTEVYMQLIADVLQNGRQAIMLVPEISLTPQMIAHFKGRFGDNVAVLHSRLSNSLRNQEWMRIANGSANIVVGARSAIFAPFERLSLIIIDEEQETSYKSEDASPRYKASVIARMRGKLENVTVVYGSATPSVETYYKARNNEMLYLPMLKRCNNSQLPNVEIVDMAKERSDLGGFTVFSRLLISEMKQNRERQMQTILFVPRRGFTGNMLCHSCGRTMKCGKCNIPMTVHVSRKMLICHYCGNAVRLPDKCPACSSREFDSRGVGTERAEEELQKLFPGDKILRMDTDTTSVKDGHANILTEFAGGGAHFLVGTQMIAKGHDFPRVTLVGVLSADSLLNTPDFRSSERTFQLLTQVAGRAGRSSYEGRVVIQAYNIDDYAITAAINQDYGEFYNNEIIIRKNLRYPPFCSMCQIRCVGENDKEVYDYTLSCAVMMRNISRDMPGSIEVLGPARDVVPKINEKFRWCVIIKADSDEMLHAFVSKCEASNPVKNKNIHRTTMFD